MNKVTVVTGASSGFGALTARALARLGHVVLGVVQQHARRDAPISVAILCGQGRDGFARSQLRERVHR